MMRIGIICPSEIAFRRFLPALNNLPNLKFVGVAIAALNEWENEDPNLLKKEKEKALNIIEGYGGRLFESYSSIIDSNETDAIYIPLPPALHHKWAKLALLSEKHVLVEKPFTTSNKDTEELIAIAKQKNLAIHENYMFLYHSQFMAINKIIEKGLIGDVRSYQISFGFPRRASNDFRYNKYLGGGALLDCGGYTIKLATMLLGENAKIVYANSNFIDDFEVDIFGTAILVNEYGTNAHITYGMDNAYKCDLEVWGSKGILKSERVFTAPAGFIPEVILKIGNEFEIIKLSADDAFMKSIQKFQECIENTTARNNRFKEILKQAELVAEFIEKANN